MKIQLKNCFLSSNLMDWVKLIVLIMLNLGYCLYWVIITMYIGFLANDWVPYIGCRNEIVNMIAICVPLIALSILAGMLISKFRVWVASLPIQFLLYVVAMYLAYGSGIVIGGALSIVFCANVTIILIFIQLPGVVVGHFIRKAQARRKQAIES